MINKPLPENENIYETECPILYAMEIIGQKWKLPILWYIADAEDRKLRYRELESDGLISRTQYNTIPPTVEYALTERGTSLIPALESVYRWAEGQIDPKQGPQSPGSGQKKP